MGYYLNLVFDSSKESFDRKILISRFCDAGFDKVDPPYPTIDVCYYNLNAGHFFLIKFATDEKLISKGEWGESRLSWGTGHEQFIGIAKDLIEFGGKLGYKLYDPQINQFLNIENLGETAEIFNKQSGRAISLFGTTKPEERIPMRRNPRKSILTEPFQNPLAVIYGFCVNCGNHLIFDNKTLLMIADALKLEIPEKLEDNYLLINKCERCDNPYPFFKAGFRKISDVPPEPEPDPGSEYSEKRQWTGGNKADSSWLKKSFGPDAYAKFFCEGCGFFKDISEKDIAWKFELLNTTRSYREIDWGSYYLVQNACGCCLETSPEKSIRIFLDKIK